jgi:S-adenosylmethionine hydrolase
MKPIYAIYAIYAILITFFLSFTTLALAQPNGLIVLITDYGTKDFYVGALKGAIYSTNPKAKVDEISHEVEKFNIFQGAYLLAKAAIEFPSGTTFVAIVDPGVGTERKPIVLKTKNDMYFVGPDNGIFTIVAEELGVDSIYQIQNTDIMRKRKGSTSTTFHGRDIFGPGAARIADGFPIEKVGKKLADYVKLKGKRPKVESGKVIGNIVHIDEYGNAITDIPKSMLTEIGISKGDLINVTISAHQLKLKFVSTYGDVPVGEFVGVINSSGVFEIAINQGNLAEKLKVKGGEIIAVSKN